MLLGANAPKAQPEKQPLLPAKIPLTFQKQEPNQRVTQAAVIPAKAQPEKKQDFFDLFERPPKAMPDARNPDFSLKKTAIDASTKPAHGPSVEQLPTKQTLAPVLDQYNPLKSEQTQNYITEKLLEHRQHLIDQYGSSKVPTPVMSVIKPMMFSSDS